MISLNSNAEVFSLLPFIVVLCSLLLMMSYVVGFLLTLEIA